MTLQFYSEHDPKADIIYRSKRIKRAVFATDNDPELVSCVMVSRGNVNILRHSLNCYKRQTYKNRELIIVSQHISEPFKTCFETSLRDSPTAYLYPAPASLKLGDLRNMSIARSRGRYICTWDDDDLHHEKYLEYMMGFILSNKVDAAFLDQLTIWWPRRMQFSLSHQYVWEGSMVASRSVIPIYPFASIEEDTAIKNAIVNSRAFALLSAPHLYTYTVTGKNTWDESHFESVTTREGTVNSAPGQYKEISARLDEKYDIAEYEKYLLSARELDRADKA